MLATRVRAVLRLLALSAATVVLYTIYMIGRVVTRGSRRWRNALVRMWARGFARCIALRSTVEGAPPRGSFLMVANHVSWVDIILLAQHADVVFIAMHEMRGWPAIGKLASTTGTIFINRDLRRDALRVATIIDDAMRDGAGILLFPEAAASDGTNVLPFKPALLDAAARTATPVYYATLQYARPEIAWYGEMPLMPHAWALLQMPHIDATLRFGGSIVERDRKKLAERLRNAVREPLLPARDPAVDVSLEHG